MQQVIIAYALAWGVMAVLVGSDAGVGWLFGLFALLTGFFIALIGFLIPLVTWALIRRRPPMRSWCLQVVTLLLVAVAAFLWTSGSAFVLRFKLSSRSLNAYVQGLPPTVDREGRDRVGLFTIKRTVKVEEEPGTVYLFTTDAVLWGQAGLAYRTEGKPAGFAESGISHLNGPWWHLLDSW